MNTLKHISWIAELLLLSGIESVFGGQELVGPIKDFVDHSALVVIVDVKRVSKVEVSTEPHQMSIVYVAEADVLQTLKSDCRPIPEKRKIAIVGSTIPMSSAVWKPIEYKRYLAFLNREQGHYGYGEYAMRPISPQGMVQWYEKNSKGNYEFFEINIEEAIKRIKSEQ